MQEFSKVFCYGFRPLSSKLARQGTFTRICHYVTPTYDYCNYSILANSYWYAYPSSTRKYFEAILCSNRGGRYSNPKLEEADDYVFHAVVDIDCSDVCEFDTMFGDLATLATLEMEEILEMEGIELDVCINNDQ